jgi:hypothetical protein
MSSGPTEHTAERRRHPRVEAGFEVRGCPCDGGVVARMVARNLSLAGLQCVSSADFPEMTRLAVRMLLPDAVDPVELEAVVVRSEHEAPSAGGEARYRLSLFFTGVGDTARERLARFLAAS